MFPMVFHDNFRIVLNGSRGSRVSGAPPGGLALRSSDQCSQISHCSDILARAGEVLAVVSQLPRAAPEQNQGSRDLLPLEPTRPRPVGHTGIQGGIRITYSDTLRLIVAESAKLLH